VPESAHCSSRPQRAMIARRECGACLSDWHVSMQ
jgi:hypothetical protein